MIFGALGLFGAMDPFHFGVPEAKAVLLAVGIIGTWAAIRYGPSAAAHPRE